MTQGYYSLIQYCPDLRRLEVCNLGVVLLCPGVPYFDVKMVQEHSRALTIFGKKHLPYLEMCKEHFAKGIINEGIVTLEGLNTYISRLGNDIRMTKPRSMAVDSTPDLELQRLFRELFPKAEKSPKKEMPDITAQLHEAIKKNGVPNNRVALNLPKVRVPGFSNTITPCFGFQNGSFHLVLSEYFTPRRTIHQIGYHLFMGQKLSEERHYLWGDQRLFLLAITDDDIVKKQIEDNRSAFDNHNVTVRTDLYDVVNFIKTGATDIPADVLAKIISVQSA